jgi:hypothetical protein
MYERRRVEHGRTSAEDVGTCGHGRKNLAMGARPLLCTSLAVSTILFKGLACTGSPREQIGNASPGCTDLSALRYETDCRGRAGTDPNVMRGTCVIEYIDDANAVVS